MRFTIADFLPTFWTLVSTYEVTLYKIVKGGVISSRVESGLLVRFARSSTTINVLRLHYGLSDFFV